MGSGILWHTLANIGILWHTLAYSCILWHTLAYSVILWHILAYSGNLWHTLAYSGILWHTLAYSGILLPDMEFVQKFTLLDFQVKNFTPSILPNFNSFSNKTLPKALRTQALTALTKNFGLVGLVRWVWFGRFGLVLLSHLLIDAIIFNKQE